MVTEVSEEVAMPTVTDASPARLLCKNGGQELSNTTDSDDIAPIGDDVAVSIQGSSVGACPCDWLRIADLLT